MNEKFFEKNVNKVNKDVFFDNFVSYISKTMKRKLFLLFKSENNTYTVRFKGFKIKINVSIYDFNVSIVKRNKLYYRYEFFMFSVYNEKELYEEVIRVINFLNKDNN